MDLLQAREERKIYVLSLFEKYQKTIVTLKANIVGNDKNPPFIKGVIGYHLSLFCEEYKNQIVYQEFVESIDGNTYFYVIDDDPNKVKEYTTTLESSDIGRLIDFDVFYEETLSRGTLRKCLICDESAFHCIRNQTHTVSDVLLKTKEIVKEFYSNMIMDFTNEAIMREVSLHPKFGLVTKHSSGSHRDMNYYTFKKSKEAIESGLKQYVLEGFKETLDVKELIRIGKQTEKDMFQATRNINTHKGLIFLLGLLLPQLSRMFYFEDMDLKKNIQNLSKEVIGDYYDHVIDKRELSHADVIYLKHGIKGIRGEALNGLPLLFDDKILVEDLDCLMYFMSKLDDTTIIHKTNISTLERVKKDMNKLLSQGGVNENMADVKILTSKYIKENISPGGSADYLVCQFILNDCMKILKTE